MEPLPALNLSHLRTMTDDTGLLQHAIFRTQRREDGYCIDDNARALLLMTLLEAEGLGEPGLAGRYLAFVNHAYHARNGRFRNFMSYGRVWLEEAGSEDSHGRTLWALGTVANRASDPDQRQLAAQLFQAALPVAGTFAFPRSWAFTLLGLNEYLGRFREDGQAQGCATTLAERLLKAYRWHRGDNWRWFEDRVTYDNARLPQALLLSAARLGQPLTEALEALTWLCEVQTGRDGSFAPVGSQGFYPRGGTRAGFDQQPLEACATVSACLDAWKATGDEIWQTWARWAFAWYLGGNQLGLTLVDDQGGCRDGLEPTGMNENRGAESTLSFLLSQAELLSIGRIPQPGSRA